MIDLAGALLAFQKDAPTVQKTALNPHYRNKFVPLDELLDATLPKLNENGLVLTQSPSVVDGHPALRTRITHAESGEYLEDVMLLMAAKDDPQGQGSALTYARRYALMATLGLVADEDDDGERASSAGAGTDGPGALPSPSAPDARADNSAESKPDYDGTAESIVVPFGKHKNKTLGQIQKEDKGYLVWLAGPTFDANAATEAVARERRLIKNGARLLLGLGADPLPIPDDDIPF